MIRLLKDENDELMDITSDTKKNKELLKMKNTFMSYFLNLSFVSILLLVFALVITQILK